MDKHVVTTLFPKAVPLLTYLQVILEDSLLQELLHLLKSKDEKHLSTYNAIAHDIYIINDAEDPMIKFKTCDNKRNLQQILYDAAQHWVSTGRQKKQEDINCLCFGYEKMRDHPNQYYNGASGGVVCSRNYNDIVIEHTNTIHALLLSSVPWNTISDFLGESIIRKILSLPCFMRMHNGSFIQVAGKLTSQLIHANANTQSVIETKPYYYSRKKGVNCNNKFVISGASQIPRRSIFYNFMYNRYAGLPSRHVMRKSGTTGTCLVKHIFMPYRQLFDSYSNYLGHVQEADAFDPAQPVMKKLSAIFATVLMSYKCIGMLKTLQKFCPLHSAGVSGGAADKGGTGGAQQVEDKVFAQIIESIHSRENDEIFLSKLGDNSDDLSDAEPESQLTESVDMYNSDVDGDEHTFDESPTDILVSCLYPTQNTQVTDDVVAATTTPTSTERESVVPAVTNGPKSKKRKRGCRGGTRRKQTQLVHRYKKEVIHKTTSSVKNAAQPTRKKLIRVGDRLLGKIVVSSRRDDYFRASGYFTQDESDEGSDCSSSMCSDQPSSEFMYDVSDEPVKKSNGKKRVKRVRHRVRDARSTMNISQESLVSSADGFLKAILLRDNKFTEVSTGSDPEVAVNTANQRDRKRIQLCHSALYDKAREGVAAASDEVNLLSWVSPVSSVSDFVKSVCRRTFTRENIWKSNRNMNVFMAAIDTYVHLGCKETMSIAQLSQHFHVKDMVWLWGDDAGTSKKRKRIHTHHSLVQSIFQIFLFWLFDDFVNPLLGACFYVTEAQDRGCEVGFYRKPTWSKVVSIGKEQIKAGFVPIAQSCSSKNKSKNKREVLKPLIRFVPKTKSIRPICHYPTDWDLQIQRNHTLQVLKHLCHYNRELVGFGLDGGDDDLYFKIRQYKSTVLKGVDDAGTKFYVAVLDLEKCFDNVNTSILYDLLDDILDGVLDSTVIDTAHGPAQRGAASDDFYYLKGIPENNAIIQKYVVCQHIKSMEIPISKTVSHVCLDSDLIPFKDAAPGLCGKYRQAVISDRVRYPRVTLKHVKDVIKTHLFDHEVKMPFCTDSRHSETTGSTPPKSTSTKNQNIFQQIRGIPQGSVLSVMLCNLYYGHAERKLFGSNDEVNKLGIGTESLVMRKMDDYIMISTCKESVEHWLQKIYTGLKLYDSKINPLKTRVNFDCAVDIEGSRVALPNCNPTGTPHQHITWCGYLLDMTTLEWKPSFCRMLEIPLKYSVDRMSGGRSVTQGSLLRRVMKAYMRTKTHALVLDTEVINTVPTVVQNIYTIFLMAAMRTHCYLLKSDGGLHKVIHTNTFFLCQCIDEAVVFGARLIHCRTKNKLTMPKGRTLTLGSVDRNYRDAAQDAEGNPYQRFVQAIDFDTKTFGSCEITTENAVCLGFKAFIRVLTHCNYPLYHDVVKYLRSKLEVARKSLEDDKLLEAYDRIIAEARCDGLIDAAILT